MAHLKRIERRKVRRELESTAIAAVTSKPNRVIGIILVSK